MIRLYAVLFLAAVAYLLWRSPALLRRTWTRQWLTPTLVACLALLYAGSPIDLIPDVTPIGAIDDLIVLATAFWWARQRLQGKPAEPRSTRTEAPRAKGQRIRWDPYAVLGVERGATADEITRAYREQLKRYHPDLVANLGEDLRRVAHEKTLEINRAYEELS